MGGFIYTSSSIRTPLPSANFRLPCLRRTYLLRVEALHTAPSSIQLRTTWSRFSPSSTAKGRHVVHLPPAKQTAWVAVPTRKTTGAFRLTDVGTPAVTCRSARSTAKLRRPIPFISDVKETQDPEEALSLFHEYHQMGFKHNYPSYSAILYKLARRRNFEAIDAVLGLVRDRNIHCKDTLFIALIQHYEKADLVEKAVDLFHQMPSFNCVCTLQCFNELLNVLVDGCRFSDADEIFGRCSTLGFRPNSISYNIMIKGWLQKGDWEEAWKVFDEMLEKKVQPSVVTYNSLIGFFGRKGELEKATGLFEDMRQKGKYPNAVTYALLMEGLCLAGKHDEAKKIMFDMEYRGCKPRLMNYGVLMSDLGKRGKTEEAKSFLQKGRRGGLRRML